MDKENLINISEVKCLDFINETYILKKPKDLAKGEKENSELSQDNSDIRINVKVITPKEEKEEKEPLNFKTPEKISKVSFRENDSDVLDKSVNGSDFENLSTEIMVNKKFYKKSIEQIKEFKTPEKRNGKEHLEDNQGPLALDLEIDNDEGMMSEVEQARLVMAATKNLPGSSEKKLFQSGNTGSPQHLLSGSPGTPRKRAKLITLASPKTKKFKEI